MHSFLDFAAEIFSDVGLAEFLDLGQVSEKWHREVVGGGVGEDGIGDFDKINFFDVGGFEEMFLSVDLGLIGKGDSVDLLAEIALCCVSVALKGGRVVNEDWCDVELSEAFLDFEL